VTDLMTEQEQIEQLKAWIKEYGMTVIAGIVLALVIMGIWRMWDTYTTNKLIHASAVYDEMLNDRMQNTKDSLAAAATQADKLISHYKSTPYAQIAALMLARDAVINKKYDDAIKNLDWVVSHSKNKPLVTIAHIRAARIYITQNQPEKAVEILQEISDKSFQGLRDEVLGDAYVQMKKIQDAKQSYQLALKELPAEDTSSRPILEMKLYNL
jgi:predicted negative regulator of RcsB-dependent stress response